MDFDTTVPTRPRARGLTCLWVLALLLFAGGFSLRGIVPGVPLVAASAAEESEESPAGGGVEEEIADLRRESRRTTRRRASRGRALRIRAQRRERSPARGRVTPPAPRSSPAFISPLRV